MNNNETRPASKTPYIAAGILGLAVVGGFFAWMFGVGKTADTADQAAGDAAGTPQSVTPGEGDAGTAATGTAYKDGMFTDVGRYASPAGEETVKVTLTLKDGTVTEAAFTGNAVNPASKTVQQKFAEGYKSLVVGKKVDAISLGVVNGSSLTPKGFMDALAKIKAQAQS